MSTMFATPQASNLASTVYEMGARVAMIFLVRAGSKADLIIHHR